MGIMGKKGLIILTLIIVSLVAGGLYVYSLLDRQTPSVGEEGTPTSAPSVPSFSQTVTGETIERQNRLIYQQAIKVAIGDSIILGRITDELADLGTIKKGDKASYKIVIHNDKDESIHIVVNTTGNITQVVDFDYAEVVSPQSSGNITVNISGDTEGSYSGTITVEQVSEE